MKIKYAALYKAEKARNTKTWNMDKKESYRKAKD
jgi:hypothetical protein